MTLEGHVIGLVKIWDNPKGICCGYIVSLTRGYYTCENNKLPPAPGVRYHIVFACMHCSTHYNHYVALLSAMGGEV
jgi:hypothetical protein